MKLTPLGRTKPTPVALLTPGHRELHIETIYGTTLATGKHRVEAALEKLKGFTCYVGSGVERLKHTTGATSWQMSTWNGRETRMTHVPSGTVVVSLRGVVEQSSEPFADLMTCLTWLAQYRVMPGSISGMAWNLLRASTYDPINLMVDPALSSEVFFGGRQQIHHPGSFFNVRAVDVVAAYPTAQAARPYALSLRQVSPSTVVDPEVSGLARALVYVPETLVHAPLPVRLGPDVIQFQYGPLNGIWSWVELANAREMGCSVEVLECWAPRTEAWLFSEWWDLAKTGRTLPGAAGTMAKAIANATWAQFAMRGDKAGLVRWADDKGEHGVTVHLPERAMPHRFALHVAAETTARVRVQTLSAIMATRTTALHIDTDGYLAFNDEPLPENTGAGFGQWRVKADMVEVEIRAPQFYRYRTPVALGWQYVASGMTVAQAAETYRTHHRVSTRVAYLGEHDAVLPPAGVFEWEKQMRWMRELEGLR